MQRLKLWLSDWGFSRKAGAEVEAKVARCLFGRTLVLREPQSRCEGKALPRKVLIPSSIFRVCMCCRKVSRQDSGVIWDMIPHCLVWGT
uniref:Uncharacterized protein n=1 Tax=Fagus sylvatica TaxID=28930 RepID=A0A2N9HHK7_FAGSY